MKVTVYIPTRNRCALLRRAVTSVLRQTYYDIDLIVVDDGSTDGTQKYLSELERSGTLRVICNRNRFGACHSRNEAIEAAQGLFVTGLDDDDFFQPERVQCFVEHWHNICPKFKRTTAGLFDSVCIKSGSQKKLLYEKLIVEKKDLKKANLIGNQVFAPKAHYINAGLFDPQMPAWQDWDLWLRMASMFGSFFNIKKGTYVIVPRKNGADDSISTKPEFMIRYASDLFIHKHKLGTLSEKSAIKNNLLNYCQVKPSLHDIAILLSGGYVRAGVRMSFKKSRLLI